MNPAYDVPLDSTQYALLGELTVALGQVDEIMIRTVTRLLNVDREAANLIMGSSKVADNSGIWKEVIRNRTQDLDILWLVTHATAEIAGVSKDRNDFIHLWFEKIQQDAWGGAWGKSWGGSWSKAVPSVRRVRKAAFRPVADLQAVKDRAARLSCVVAHIDYLLSDERGEPSPWLEKISPPLPPRPQQDTTTSGQ